MQLVFSYIQLKSTYERANLATETNVPQRLIKYVVRFQKKKKKVHQETKKQNTNFSYEQGRGWAFKEYTGHRNSDEKRYKQGPDKEAK